MRWDCWVLLGPGRGRRDDGGTEGVGRGMGAAWDVFSRSGGCVQFWGRCVQFFGECVQFRAQCVQFSAECVQFRGNVSTLAGDVSSFGWGALVGDGAGTEGEIPRLRCAALEMTAAAGEVRSGCVRGRGVVRQAHQGRWVRWDRSGRWVPAEDAGMTGEVASGLVGGGEWLVTRVGVGLGGVVGRTGAGDGGGWQ